PPDPARLPLRGDMARQGGEATEPTVRHPFDAPPEAPRPGAARDPRARLMPSRRTICARRRSRRFAGRARWPGAAGAPPRLRRVHGLLDRAARRPAARAPRRSRSMPATAADSRIFGDIFSTEPMRRIFSDEARVQYYLDIEAALARVQARLGIIPAEAADEIGRHCRADEMDFAELKAATERIGYPVLPVVQQLVARCRDGLGEWCHWGATTQDITDTAAILQIRDALVLVEDDLAAIADSLEALARRHRRTVMAGRSNLQHAVPITFGYKMAVLLAGVERHRARLAELRPRVLVLEFGGAAGTLASLGARGLEVQEALAAELGLAPPEIAWHTMRDRIAEVAAFLGL